MKVKNIRNKKAFFTEVNRCAGKVELFTSDGDILNLKSTLCQYIALTQMFDDDNAIVCELKLSNPDDYALIQEYLILDD